MTVGAAPKINHPTPDQQAQGADIAVGLIEKSIRKRGNQKLAAPVYTTTKLSKSEVITAIKRIADDLTTENIARLNKNRAGNFFDRASAAGVKEARITCYVEVRQKEILISYFHPPKTILAIEAKRLKADQAYWLAEVAFMKAGPEVPEGQLVVRLTLKRWVINKDGKIKNKVYYEVFAHRLHDAISSNA